MYIRTPLWFGDLQSPHTTKCIKTSKTGSFGGGSLNIWGLPLQYDVGYILMVITHAVSGLIFKFTYLHNYVQ